MNKNVLLVFMMLIVSIFATTVNAAAPVIAPANIVGTVITSSGDIIEITFSSNVKPVDGTWSSNEFEYIESPSGVDLDLSHASFSYSGSKLTITLNEATDAAYLTSGSTIVVKPALNKIVSTSVATDYVANAAVTSSTPSITKNMLVLNNVEWKVTFPRSEDPDNNDGDLTDGEDIEVGEGSTVKITGDVESLFTTSMTIEDIEVTLVVRDIDSGDDYDEDVNIDDLDEGDDDSFSFEFKVPYDEFEDGDTASATLRVEGTDERGNVLRDEMQFSLDIEQDSEEITIMSAVLSNSEVTCEDEITLTVEIKNTGRADLDEDNSGVLTVVNTKLKIGQIVKDIEMSEDEDDSSNVQTFSFPINVSGIAPSATAYALTVKAYTDYDELSDAENVMLKVGECKSRVTTTTIQATTTTSKPSVTTTTATMPTWSELPEGQNVGPNYAQTPVSGKKSSDSDFTNSMTYIVMLGAIILLLIVIGLLLVTSMMRRR